MTNVLSPSSSSPTDPPTPKLHALDLSEIRALIAQYLVKQDLAYCVLVSKSWSQGYMPHYWHTVNISPHKLARCHASALERYGHYVRCLEAGRIEDTSVFNQHSVSHVQRLEVSTCGDRYREDSGRGCLQEIVQRNQTTLITLHWRCYGRDTLVERPFRLWASMFSGLENLVTIELSNWSISRMDFVRVLNACPMLNTMAFEATEEVDGGRVIDHKSFGTQSVYDRPLRDGSSSLLTFQHGGLQRLDFTGIFIPSLLQHVPTIKRLDLIHLHNGEFQNVSDQVKGLGCLSGLAHLTTRTCCISPTQYMALAGAISHLVHFEGMVPLSAMSDFLELVLENHSQTIEHLVFVQLNDSYEPLRFRFNLWRFFETCPRLITLEIPFQLDYCMTWTTTTATTTSTSSTTTTTPDWVEKLYEPTKEWVCNDLRQLQLRIKDMNRMSPMDQITFDLCIDRLLPPEKKRNNTKRTRTALERMILERLSGLENLKRLHIGSGWYDLPTRPQK